MKHEFLFIGGAPRSGTTLLRSLLDGHKQMLVFPGEHSTIERTIWNRDRLESYAREEFITGRREGQQAMLANPELYKEKQQAFASEFSREFEVQVNRQAFHDAYIAALTDSKTNLGNILTALAVALSKSNSFAEKAYPQAKLLCFKQPFFTELFATEAAELLPNCKFLHLVRDPIARYTSAKTRRVKQSCKARRRLGPINRFSYVEGHTLIDAASRRLAQLNQETLGPTRYKIIQFEELATNPSQSIADILAWLSLEPDEEHTSLATRLGQPADSKSVISTGEGIDASATRRSNQYYELTSWNERLIHSALLDQLIDGKSHPRRMALLAAYLTPLPMSNLRNYCCQILGMYRCLRADYDNCLNIFLNNAKLGKTKIGGTT